MNKIEPEDKYKKLDNKITVIGGIFCVVYIVFSLFAIGYGNKFLISNIVIPLFYLLILIGFYLLVSLFLNFLDYSINIKSSKKDIIIKIIVTIIIFIIIVGVYKYLEYNTIKEKQEWRERQRNDNFGLTITPIISRAECNMDDYLTLYFLDNGGQLKLIVDGKDLNIVLDDNETINTSFSKTILQNNEVTAPACTGVNGTQHSIRLLSTNLASGNTSLSNDFNVYAKN